VIASPPTAGDGARDRARAEWRHLADRLATITPRALGRYGLVGAVIAGAAWLVVASWPALLPFLVGAGIAYAVFPIVSRLAVFMPRPLAALAGVFAALALVVGVFLVVLPVLARGVVQLATELPTADDLDRRIAEIQASLGTLPPGAAGFVRNVLTQVSTQLRGGLDGASEQLANLALQGVRVLIGVVAVAIGLIALPTWILTVLRDRAGLRRAVEARTAPWLRADVSAVFRIADRAGRAYVRGSLGAAVIVGVLVYLGLAGAARLGSPAFTQAAPIAAFAGVVQVIPAIGPLLGVVPAALILAVSPERAAVYLAVYVLALWLGGSMIGGRLAGQRLHPALLVPGIVALSQFGILWLLLAGPVLAITHDLVRYLFGRLSEPPRPAGVIPDESPRAAAVRPAARVVPSVYLARRSR
jgi:predicted PurR-regulated permease PerM